MIGKTLLISSVIIAMAAMAKSKYAMSYAMIRSGGSFGAGLDQVRKKNRRNKAMRRRRSH